MLVRIVIVVAALAAAAPAEAQTTPSPPVTVGWDEGLQVQSAGGDYRLQVGTLIQVDGRMSADTPSPIADAVILRKARPIVAARVGRHVGLELVPDFAGGGAAVTDAYVDARASRALGVRAGKAKMPVSYEVLIGDANVPFPERSLTASLVPRRDVGVQVQGESAARTISYAGGVFSGVPDGTSATEPVDGNG